jgi:hypothetical protein
VSERDVCSQAANTDRELWREKNGDYYSPFVFVTDTGRIGMCADGICVVQPIKNWIDGSLGRRCEHGRP